LRLPDPVKQLAISRKLSKSKLHRKAPAKFTQVVTEGSVRAFQDLVDWSAKVNEVRPLSEVTARQVATSPALRRQERYAAVANAVYITTVETGLQRLIYLTLHNKLPRFMEKIRGYTRFYTLESECLAAC
jgi:hypothetical protein